MFDRKLYKANGKQAFQRNYWMCVAVALVIVLLCEGMLTTVFSVNEVRRYVPRIRERAYYGVQNGSPYNAAEFKEYTDINDTEFLQFSNASGYGYEYKTEYKVKSSSALWTLLGIFVFGVLGIGGRKFFMNNRFGNGRFEDLFVGFKGENYLSNVWTMFAVGLQVFLWSLLLVIPGIIKAYEYAMVPYIAADNPGMKKKEVFARSKELMQGHKWDLFVFDLSFLGWDILSLLTANVLGFLYVFPYKKAATAEVYYALKNRLL